MLGIPAKLTDFCSLLSFLAPSTTDKFITFMGLEVCYQRGKGDKSLMAIKALESPFTLSHIDPNIFAWHCYRLYLPRREMHTGL